jgi:Ser/Thr protein kinase RdoA (MazF antagonist)
MDIEPVLAAYGLSADADIVSFGSGLINSSWKVHVAGKDYLVQRINNFVFQDPHTIADNIKGISAYLSHHHPDYFFVAPLPAANGSEMICLEALGYFRIFPFVQGSHTVDVAQTPQQAFEAALQFGRFGRVLSGFDANRLRQTIPGFHDLNLRYRQYTTALKEGNSQRLQQSLDVLRQLKELHHIVGRYQQIGNDPAFRLRATHHDTKISNVLFDEKEKGLCVIDLDTVMPGYFISDVGDMMRTYLSPVSEEEPDINLVRVRKPFYEAIVAGYLQEMHAVLSAAERAAFCYAGQFMTYMQALRFITDFLNNDVYYGARYPDHNLVRAKNQLALLQQLTLLEKELNASQTLY